ncbi:Ltp family lipoprotein [Peribacillus frigoritolerans]|uniref:Ltp family lipoprotein n=1 Tax=Peribacillus frigoritolerans TaxID=450367 RepID=UPI003CFD9A02
MFRFLGLLFVFGTVFFILAAIISAFRKTGKVKKMLLSSVGSFILLIVVAFIAISNEEAESLDETETEVETTYTEPTVEEPEANDENVEITREKEIEEVKEEPKKAEKEEEPKEPEVPTEYKSALQKAESYAEIMSMSKQGIYNQLTSEAGEQFPEDAAQYAIDNIKWDWKENALKKAKEYTETMAMSKDAVYDQLISEAGEQFTPKEAQYAIDNLDK